mmetsp:Transcript_28781/g.95652  ORF Transcript_28781/g.95652 Transcript_28781/m.95652 type:complete len:235 (-) Transcript_28781:719-1423(-)
MPPRMPRGCMSWAKMPCTATTCPTGRVPASTWQDVMARIPVKPVMIMHCCPKFSLASECSTSTWFSSKRARAWSYRFVSRPSAWKYLTTSAFTKESKKRPLASSSALFLRRMISRRLSENWPVKPTYAAMVAPAQAAQAGPAILVITARAMVNSTAMGNTLKSNMFRTCVSDCVARETTTLRAPGLLERRYAASSPCKCTNDRRESSLHVACDTFANKAERSSFKKLVDSRARP